MTIRAVFFDLGGVIVRTEFQAPREQLAARLGMTYNELVRAVFDSKSSHRASLGLISTDEHLDEVLRSLGLPPEQKKTVHKEFFDGDVVDIELISFIRGLRPDYRTGLISNAWPDLRDYIVRQKFDDAFDHMIISAEVGLVKPDERIYQLALEKLGVAPEESVFVDDFIENIEGCQALGMHGIHFRSQQQALEELKQLLANHS